MKHTHTIKLLTGATLICRIAGQSGDGVNVIGLHTPFLIVDEAGYYPWGTWLEAQPIINYWEEGYRVITSGVPTGLRQKLQICSYHARQYQEIEKSYGNDITVDE